VIKAEFSASVSHDPSEITLCLTLIIINVENSCAAYCWRKQ